jgi:hypothetical protein
VPDSGQNEPRIAAPLVNGVRSQLIQDGRWPEIEAHVLGKDPELAPWLEQCERAEWTSLVSHLRFMEILLEHIGEEALESLGGGRFRDDMAIGPLAPVLRGWVREYRHDPAALMRVAPHAWQAVTRNAGRMVLVEILASAIRFRVEGPPNVVLTSRAWHILLRGYGAELLRQSGRQGSFSVEPSGGSLALEARWSAA